MKTLARYLKIQLQGMFFMLSWGMIIFLAAGTWHWGRGWFCVLFYIITMSISGILVESLNPGLIQRRTRLVRKDTKSFDRIILRLYIPLTFIQPLLAGLDAVRYRWSSLPFWTIYPGILLQIIATILITWVLLKNPHAETSVRIQHDQSHSVVRSGPYQFVRHPMYVGAILSAPATALILGSAWSFVIAALVAIILVIRTALEDKTLQQELPGYREYTEMTRYRLVPGLW